MVIIHHGDDDHDNDDNDYDDHNDNYFEYKYQIHGVCISSIYRETWWRTNVEEHPDGQVSLKI